MADRYEELSTRERLFVDLYIESKDAYNSALKAGWSRNTARCHAYGWVRRPFDKPVLYETIQARLQLVRDRNFADAEAVRERAWLIATADPRELIETKVYSCRYCHGEEHAYHWRLSEYEAAVIEAEEAREALPDCSGGFGFDPFESPHPECPRCKGNGEQVVSLKDTRDLSASALALFKGVKQTKQGIEVLMHDQQAAMRLYAELSGYQVSKKEISGPGGVPLEMPTRIVLVAHE